MAPDPGYIAAARIGQRLRRLPVVTADGDVSGPTRATTVNLSGYAIGLEGGVVSFVEILDFYNGTRLDLGAALLGSDGTWHFAASSLAGGVHQFWAVATGPAASAGMPAAPCVKVDTTGPALKGHLPAHRPRRDQ